MSTLLALGLCLKSPGGKQREGGSLRQCRIPYTRHPSPCLTPWQSLQGLGWEKAGAYFLAMDLNSRESERERRVTRTQF